MGKKKKFELDKSLMTDNRIDLMEPLEDDFVEFDGEILNIEIGEMDYDPSSGAWKEKQSKIGNEPEEIPADYKVCEQNKPEPKEARRRSRKSARKKRKPLPLSLQIAYGVLTLACLTFSFMAPVIYMQSHVIASTLEKKDAALTADGQVEKIPIGTYATIKSNSLDGVPVYGNAGDQAQITFIPEGKYLQLKDNVVVDGQGWVQIDYCGIEGWVLQKHVHFVTEEEAYIKEDSTIYVDAQTEFGIKAYKKPDNASKEVGDGIRYGTEFQVKKMENGWAKIDYKGKSGWINMFFMGSYGTRHWKVETLTSAGAMNLRREPEEGKKVLCKIPEGTVLTILEFHNGWGLVEYEGNEGWVMLHYLNPTEE